MVDPDRVEQADQDAALGVTRSLPGYSGSFVDNSLDPRTPEEIDSDAAAGRSSASVAIVDVAVTEDPAGAEAAIRQVWGGGICVTSASRTAEELRRVQDAMIDVPGFLGNGTEGEQVTVHVVYDDGSLAEALGEEYAAGLVVLTSALTDV